MANNANFHENGDNYYYCRNVAVAHFYIYYDAYAPDETEIRRHNPSYVFVSEISIKNILLNIIEHV